MLGEGGHIKALEAVVAGEFAMETQTPPYSAILAMTTAKAIMEGKPYELKQAVMPLIFESSKKAQKYIDKSKLRALVVGVDPSGEKKQKGERSFRSSCPVRKNSVARAIRKARGDDVGTRSTILSLRHISKSFSAHPGSE